MQNLYEKLKKYSLDDTSKIEESDRQFIALRKLSEKISRENIGIFLWLIIVNSLICYQLSWKWEDYWEEFSKYFLEKFEKNFLNRKKILDELKNFLKNSKNNKRFISIKIWRIEKIEKSDFFQKFFSKDLSEDLSEKFYQNMENLRDILSEKMNQKKDAKTIVFAIKMFWYWARNFFEFQKYPDKIKIPIDSRLENLFKIYNYKYDNLEKNLEKKSEKNLEKIFKNSKIFYSELSKKLKIPELHLDAILWVNYEKLIK